MVINILIFEKLLCMPLMIFLSICDIREKRIPAPICITTGLTGLLINASSIVRGEADILGVLVISLILFIFSCASNQSIGKGDILVLTVIGIAAGLTALIFTMTIGILLFSCFSLGGLITKKISLHSQIPAVPFFTLAWAAWELLKGA
ncbi:MAG: prepilin peptidase [Lachnospiraceae bacterium]|jgi:prepilin signal peptidase PulO-like enzyme (type II secretory pathway)|nr:prepilin peptidase [Lachnospiraceae bacterium]MEE3460426.1 prepilin peptidase [Lachnospiraceae bacterium]